MSNDQLNEFQNTVEESRVGSGLSADSIVLPRWVVYFQGALLGVIAATFFVFGLMVGNLTSGSNSAAEQRTDVQIEGEVVYVREGQEVSDINAVVMLLPAHSKPDERSSGRAVNPDSFEPLNNEGIERVNELGGAIVRVDDGGKFDLVVDGPGDYYVVVISANRKAGEVSLSKSQTATLATFFRPVEEVVGDKEFYWSTISARGDRQRIKKVVFE